MLVDVRLSASHHPSPSPPHLLLVPHSFPACRRRRSVCCVFWFFGSPWALFHPISQHTGGVSRLPLGHPAGTVLRFRGIRSVIGPKKPDIAAHRARRDDARRESTGARHGGGAWAQNPGCGAWSAGGLGAWKRGEAAHRVWERGCRNAEWGEGWPEKKRPHQGIWVAHLLLMAKIITVWEQSMEIVAKWCDTWAIWR